MPKFPIQVFYGNQCKTLANARAFQWLCSAYRYVQAAGGIIVNERDEVLMIYRNGKWDFPKGKVEQDEPIPEAALREVEEETGVKAALVSSQPISTFHCYDTYGENVIKETFWFAMTADSQQSLLPQTEESIESVVWVPFADVEARLQDSYAMLQNLWSKYIDL